MLSSLRFRRSVVATLFVSLLSMLACQGDDSPDVLSAEAPKKEPDIIIDEGMTKGGMYLADNAHHLHKMNELLNRADVAVTVDSFGTRGFELSADFSFTVEGTSEELDVAATFIAMTGHGRSADQSAMIACFEIGGDFGIAPAVFSANPPEDESGWAPITEGVWMRDSLPSGIDLSSQRILDGWKWDYFVNCMSRQAPTIAMGCTLTCIGIPGYFSCFLFCAVVESVATAISCLIETYFYSYAKPKKQKD